MRKVCRFLVGYRGLKVLMKVCVVSVDRMLVLVLVVCWMVYMMGVGR